MINDIKIDSKIKTTTLDAVQQVIEDEFSKILFMAEEVGVDEAEKKSAVSIINILSICSLYARSEIINLKENIDITMGEIFNKKG